MEPNDNESFTNYGRVGFQLEVDSRMVPLILLRDRGKPNIGFDSHDGFHFAWLLVDFELGSTQEMETTPCFVKVSSVGFVTTFDVYLIACRQSIFLILVLLGGL